MSADGHYLRPVLDALTEWPGPKQLAICGFPGSPIARAASYVAQVANCKPDLVLVEFAVNDMLLVGDVAASIEKTLRHMRSQVLAAVDDCDFAEVYFAFGFEWVRPEFGIAPHEEFADAWGWPSFDLARLADELITAGGAAKVGADGLTRDGTHHTPLAETLIGVPFARTLAAVIRSS